MNRFRPLTVFAVCDTCVGMENVYMVQLVLDASDKLLDVRIAGHVKPPYFDDAISAARGIFDVVFRIMAFVQVSDGQYHFLCPKATVVSSSFPSETAVAARNDDCLAGERRLREGKASGFHQLTV